MFSLLNKRINEHEHRFQIWKADNREWKNAFQVGWLDIAVCNLAIVRFAVPFYFYKGGGKCNSILKNPKTLYLAHFTCQTFSAYTSPSSPPLPTLV